MLYAVFLLLFFFVIPTQSFETCANTHNYEATVSIIYKKDGTVSNFFAFIFKLIEIINYVAK